MNNALRNGNFNSSEIVALTSLGERAMTPEELEARPKKGAGSRTTINEDENGFGDAAETFIIACNMERRLGRAITDEIEARSTTWGTLLETYVHELLGMNYEYFSNETRVHPELPYWVGTGDFLNHAEPKAIADSKCPSTLTSFCQLVDPWYEGKRGADYWDALVNGWTDKQGLFHKPHKDGKKFFFQLVSNACIYGVDFMELVVFMPYQSELDDIRTLANSKGIDSPFFWIWSKSDDQLPHLIDCGYYKNLNVFRFEVPQVKKDFLRKRVELAGKKLIPHVQPIEVTA